MNKYPLKKLEIPIHIIDRDGPFHEFKQDASFVTVELNNKQKLSGVLLLYPNYVIAVEGRNNLPFQPSNVIKITQTEEDQTKRPSSDWSFFYDPEEFKNHK